MVLFHNKCWFYHNYIYIEFNLYYKKSKMRQNNLISTILICLTILAATFILTKVDFSINTGVAPDHTISVAWNGEVRATPDTLILYLRVEDTADTTAEAQKNVDEKVSQIKEIIKGYNIKDSDVKTTNINVYEAYDWTDNGRKSLWFTANHNLEIKIKSANVDNEWVGGKIVSQVSEIEWVFVNSVNYDIDDKTEYYSQARELALKKANQKAEDLAKYAWVKLGKPVSISEEWSSDYAIARTSSMKNTYFVEEADFDEAGWSDISLWEMKITLDVNVVYEIK